MSEENKTTEEELIELKKKVEQQEGLLVEQEHRFFRVLQNFFIKRRKWPKGDKKRNAATKALLYSIFFSPTTVAVTGGTAAIISLYFLWGQTKAMKEQNTSIVAQNELILEQNHQQRREFNNQRLTELTKILYTPDSVSSGRHDNIYLNRIKTNALIEYIDIYRYLHPNERVDLQNAQLNNLNLNHLNLDSVNFKGANFSGTFFRYVSMKDCDASGADFTNIRMNFVDMNNTSFVKAYFYRATLIGGRENSTSYFNNCNFSRAQFIESYIRGCDFTDANFHFVYNYKSSFLLLEGRKFKGLTNQQICSMRSIPELIHIENKAQLDSLKKIVEFSENVLYSEEIYSHFRENFSELFVVKFRTKQN